jgi:ribosomal protein S21
MHVKVNEGKEELQKSLKQFTKMIKKSELMQELRNREYFLKPSKKRAFKRQEALRRKKREERRLARQLKYNI